SNASFRSVVLQLFQIALKISFRFPQRVAAEFLERAACQRERDHGLAGNAGGGHHTYIRALVGRFHRLACREVHRLQWPPPTSHPAAHPIARNCQARAEHCAPPPRILHRQNRPCVKPCRLLLSCAARRRRRRKPATPHFCAIVARSAPKRFPGPQSKPSPPQSHGSELPRPARAAATWQALQSRPAPPILAPRRAPEHNALL